MLIYASEDLNFSIVLTDNVLEHFSLHRQLRLQDKEAGGQLFARFKNDQTFIEKATGPRLTDRRTRRSYHPDRQAERKEIAELFQQQLHYVGDWHTHPSVFPTPSGTDVSNISSCVLNSRHELNGFLMIIVATHSFPLGLRVSLHTTAGDEFVLRPV